MNELGEIVAEELSFECKVSHNIIYQDYGIVLDEVGGNTNQKGDGNISGELIMCEQGKTPQKHTHKGQALHRYRAYFFGWPNYYVCHYLLWYQIYRFM